MVKKIIERSHLVADYGDRFIWLDGVITPSMASKFNIILTKLNRLEFAPIILYVRGIGGMLMPVFQ